MIHAGSVRRHVSRRAAGQLAAVLAVAIAGGIAAGAGAHLLLAGSGSSRSAGSAAATASGASGVTTVRHGPLHGQATWAAGARPAPAITTLRDQTGSRFTLGSLHGRTVAVEFFDSHCTSECPLAGRALAASERALPAAQRPVLVVVSVNPKDTPASVRAAMRSWGLAGVAPWHWLMGNHAQLAPVWAAYHIFVKPTRGDISHTEALYLLDRRGDERSGYLFPYLPASVSHDLRVLAGRQGGERV
ncbi:MAG TPA: SCO family protein [Solirubrobacteraceae bacterium]|jgi:cytochrome oxidase Cu insertion factor (SCO1/SenC/PrrC family)|nr:SCO family protein [Solirubrobacteraceae bacterium]